MIAGVMAAAAEDRPAIVCAWCVPMRLLTPGSFPASHGICAACADRFQYEAEAAAEAAAAPAEPFHGPLPFSSVRYRGVHDRSRTPRAFAIRDGVARRFRGEVDWGYAGAGPTALARLVLVDFLAFEPDHAIVAAFRDQVIARLPMDQPWTLEAAQLRAELRVVGEVLGLSCLRCVDERRVERVPCPVCRRIATEPEPLTEED